MKYNGPETVLVIRRSSGKVGHKFLLTLGRRAGLLAVEDALDRVPDSGCKAALIQLADFAVQRRD